MEALIHHFKLVTEGFRVPPGEVYSAVESPRGELGCFVVADGSAKPARVHMRDPSFVNLQSLKHMGQGTADRRLHRLHRDARPDPRGDRPVSGPAHACPSAGIEAVDLDRDPARDPRRRRGRGAGGAAHLDPGGHAALPRHALGHAARARRRPEGARLVLARGHPPGGRGDAGDPGLPLLGGHLLRHAAHRAGRGPLRVRVHQRGLPPAPGEGRLRRHRRGGARPGADRRGPARVRVPGRVRHGADGVRRRSLRRPARSLRRPRAGERGQGGTGGAARPQPRGPRLHACPGATPVPEMRVLLRELRRARPPHHGRLRAPRGLPLRAQGGARHAPGGGALAARGLGPARPRRRRVLDGQEGELHPPRLDGQVPVLQRRRVRARHLQGPPADAAQPAPADRGMHHRLDRRGGHQGVHLHPRRVRDPGEDPRRRGGRGLREGLPRPGHLRLAHLARPRGPPRPGRLHLRRGVGAARRARGQARQPAPQAPLPRQPGPLPGTDADQQRRDAVQRAADHREGRGVVRRDGRGQVDGNQARVGVRQRQASRQLRGRAGRDRARDRGGARRRLRGGAQGQVLVPGRLLGAGAAGRAPGPPLLLRGDGRGRLDARLRGDHRGGRRPAARAAGAEAGRVLPPRELRQVRPVPRGHELDREDARAHRRGRRDPDGPRDHGRGPDEHHRQLPLRARRLDGDADRLDDQALPARVRGAHRARARAGDRAAVPAYGAGELAAVAEAGPA